MCRFQPQRQTPGHCKTACHSFHRRESPETGLRIPSKFILLLAERVGFEPTLEFPLNTLSKRAPSATRPSLRRYREATAEWRVAPPLNSMVRGAWPQPVVFNPIVPRSVRAITILPRP